MFFFPKKLQKGLTGLAEFVTMISQSSSVALLKTSDLYLKTIETSDSPMPRVRLIFLCLPNFSNNLLTISKLI